VSFPACPPWSDKRSLLPPGRPASASLFVRARPPLLGRVLPTSSVFSNARYSHKMGTTSVPYLLEGSPCSSKREKSEPFVEMCTGKLVPAVAAGAINSSFEVQISPTWESSSLAALNVIGPGRSTKTSDAFSGCEPSALLLRATHADFHFTASVCEEKAREAQASADRLAHAFRKRRDPARPR
jgi:hypothetical protein